MATSPELTIAPPLYGRIALLIGLFLVVLPHLLRFPIAITLFVTAIIGWRIAKEYYGWAMPKRWIKIALTGIATALVLSQFHSIVGRIPGSALLALLLVLKLMELHTLRDALVIICISFFLIVVGFLFSQEIYIGIYLFLVVWGLLTALILLNHPAANRDSLWLHGKTAAKLMLQALPLMLLFFILFPRLNTPLWSMPQEEKVAKTGLSDTMDFSNITSLVDSNQVAFRVDFSGAMPAADKLYWRVMVLWQTDGSLWQRLRYSTYLLANSSPIAITGDSASATSYTITLQPHQQRWLPLLDRPITMPQGLDVPPTVLPDLQLLTEKAITKALRYELQSLTSYSDKVLDTWQWQAGLQLPENRHPRSAELARSWKQQGLSDQQIVTTALNYFRQQPFYYTRNPDPLPLDPVDQFLFDSRRGFCEHYSAAFVVLMRQAGIPARVVTGYQGGEINPLGNYLIVRQSDAHAWAEVWLDETGWQRVDPTAVIPPQRIEWGGDTQRFESVDADPIDSEALAWLVKSWRMAAIGWDYVNYSWYRWVVHFNSDRQKELLGLFAMQRWNWGLMFGVLLLTLVAAVALFSYRLWQRYTPAQRQFRKLCNLGSRAGVTIAVGETPQSYAYRFADKLPHCRDQILAAVEHYQQLVYNPNSNQTEQLQQLLTTMQQLQEHIASGSKSS